MRSIFPTNAKGTNLLISALLISSSVLIATITKAPTATAQYSPPYPHYPNPGSVYPNPGMPAPARVQSLNGSWRVSWQVNGYSMNGRLFMRGDQGVMRLRVRDANGNTQRIEQTMVLRPRHDGFALRGSNPVFRGTNIPVSNYFPDNFRVRQTPNGWAITTCDASGSCAPATMQYLGSDMVYD